MKQERVRLIIYFVLTAASGVLLHFLYDWSPNVLFAVLSPVQESVWEHLKLVFWPLLFFGLVYSRKCKETRSSWYLAVLVASGLLLLFGWVVNIRMGMVSLPVDIGAYFIILLLGYAVAAWIPVSKKWNGTLLLGIVILAVLIVIFTFVLPGGRLFANLSLADTFYSLPC